ncbi:MAG: DUF3179 domain-containing (seleno)protein [Actinomycetota bacterium]
MRTLPRLGAGVLAATLFLAACSDSDDDADDAAVADAAASPDDTTSPAAAAPAGDGELINAFGDELPPLEVDIPTGPLAPEVVEDLDLLFASLLDGVEPEPIQRLGESGDPRIAWLFADLLRFFQQGSTTEALVTAFEGVTGTALPPGLRWGPVTDRLIAWDVPAPPDYVRWKRIPYEVIEPAWEPFFDDEDADVDWRLVSWGGVLIDDRSFDDIELPCPEGCIPALNDPVVTDAAGGDWYPDDRLVFGIVINGEARAYPRNIMEVHEMVNDTLGGRRIGVPYCTLCGAAQAWLTDVDGDVSPLELRTSGLLSRSNKVMYEFNTFSVFDTFLGTALSGPLQDEGVQLEQVPVVTATWADWKAAHPETTIVAEDGGLGRSYPLDPLGGRDDDGPIFPIGDVDQRLGAQDQVLGIVGPEGPVAFDVATATETLASGGTVELAGVRVLSDGAGLVAELIDGGEAVSHQAFWFAWSQFHPTTELWVG